MYLSQILALSLPFYTYINYPKFPRLPPPLSSLIALACRRVSAVGSLRPGYAAAFSPHQPQHGRSRSRSQSFAGQLAGVVRRGGMICCKRTRPFSLKKGHDDDNLHASAMLFQSEKYRPQIRRSRNFENLASRLQGQHARQIRKLHSRIDFAQ